MTKDIEITRGSGNIFRDFDHRNADLEQLKSILAAKIIGVLDDKEISVRRAQAITGIAAADFSRIRNAQFDRFTVDRLMTILSRLDQRVKFRVSVQPHSKLARAGA
jgi:predicted XRE-type DNA-binding protein